MPRRNRDALPFAHRFLRVSLKIPAPMVSRPTGLESHLVAAGARLAAVELNVLLFFF